MTIHAMLYFGALALAGQVGGVQVTFDLEQSEFVLHEPIYGTLSIENGMNEELVFDMGANFKEFLSFQVRGSDDEVLEVPSLPGREGIFRVGEVSLAAGEPHRQRVLLNEWYEYSSPGEYRVELLTNMPFRTAFGRGVAPAEDTVIEFRVGDADAERLRAVAAELAAQVLAPSSDLESYQLQIDAALGLGHINDPVALPFIIQVIHDTSSGNLLERGLMKRRALFDGLVRMGNAEVVDALAERLDSDDELFVGEIRQTLGLIEFYTDDEELQDLIEDVLR